MNLRSDTLATHSYKLSTLYNYRDPLKFCIALRLCQKWGIILVNKVDLKLKLPNNHVLLNPYSSLKKNPKDSDDFWHRKFTLNVQNWHFLMNYHQVETQNLVISFDYSWFLAKNLAYAECLIMKFHYRNSSNLHTLGQGISWQNVFFLTPIHYPTIKFYHFINLYCCTH